MKELQFSPTDINKEELVEQLVEDGILRAFFIKNDLDTAYIEEHLSPLLNFKIEKDKCFECAGIHECKQDTNGFEPVLLFEEEQLKTYYRECAYALHRREKRRQETYIDALYMPKMIYQATLEDFDFTRGENRTLIHNRLTNFVTRYTNGELVKGLYLYGEYQKGKTYCLAAVANELSKRGVKVIIAYYPDIVREFKSRINDGSLEMFISKLKQAEVLMLDDIGGESQSAWVRDEVLGPILQHRLLDEKPTFFTSNVSQKALMSLMTLSNQKADQMKAARIDARIQSLSEEIKL